MEMLDVMKARMPEGLEIKKVKQKASANQIQIWFTYEGEEVVGYLPKVCVPGAQNQVADRTTFNAMMAVALKRKDLVMADYWMEKMLAVK